MLHFVYKVTRSDGCFYIGVHSTTTVNDGYLGSGKIIRASVKKHGVEAHAREILHFTNTKSEALEIEKHLVTEKMLADPKCLNLKLGGEGGWDHVRWVGRTHSIDARRKMSNSQKLVWTEEKKKQQSVQQSGEGNAHFGKKHSDDARRKISEGNKKPKTLTPLQREEIGNRMSAINKGKPKTDETKAKMSEARRLYWLKKKSIIE